MTSRTSLLRSTLLAAPAGAVLLAGILPAWGQQSPATPLAAVSSELKYPDGARLQEEYSMPNQSLAVPSTGEAARPAVMGLAAAARVQATLPEGFTILPGETKQIGPSGMRASAAPQPPRPWPRRRRRLTRNISLFIRLLTRACRSLRAATT